MEVQQEEQSKKLDNLDTLLRQFISSQMNRRNFGNPLQSGAGNGESSEKRSPEKGKVLQVSSPLKVQVSGKGQRMGSIVIIGDNAVAEISAEAIGGKSVPEAAESDDVDGENSSAEVTSVQVSQLQGGFT
jgi:hypothetical protein